MVGGGGIAVQSSVVRGAVGMAEQDSTVVGGGGIAEHSRSVLGGGGITGPGRVTSIPPMLQLPGGSRYPPVSGQTKVAYGTGARSGGGGSLVHCDSIHRTRGSGPGGEVGNRKART